MYSLFKVDQSRGYENPDVYIESPADVYETYDGWLCENVITGEEYEFETREEAEECAARIESYYMEGE